MGRWGSYAQDERGEPRQAEGDERQGQAGRVAEPQEGRVVVASSWTRTLSLSLGVWEHG